MLLVIDASGQSQSAAAVVKGCATYDPRIRIAGVVLNRLGSPRHARLAGDAIAALGIPVVGGLDEVVNQRLAYEFAVAEPTVFAGAVTLRLRFSCNEIDSYIVARLCRIDARGECHLLSMGALSPARRRVDAKLSSACEIAIDTQAPEPLVPGQVVPLVFSLTPAPTQLARGERIRLDIASRTDLLKSDVGHGYVHFNLPVPPYFARNTIHYGAETHLQLDQVLK